VANAKLINFEENDAANDLLRDFGFVVNLGEFLVEHLEDVLRKQYPSTDVQSIELLQLHNCSVGGMPSNSDLTIILANSFSLPVDVATIVRVEGQRAKLKLQVVIRVTGENGRYTGYETDVFVLDQMNL